MTSQKENVETAANKDAAMMAKKQNFLNMLVIAFAGITTVVFLVTFFIAVCDRNTASYSIVSLYVLCMLLACPTLKVFLDKVTCPRMRLINWIAISVIFLAILVMSITASIELVR